MSDQTGIEWTDATWNPWHGCHKVSPGCKFCYMFREKKMYGQNPDIVVRSKTKFSDPLKWKEPRRVFTCSWSDFFIEEADPWRDEAWEIIRRTPQHTYQILTKRMDRAAGRIPIPALPNVWLGVSVENQETADLRIPALLRAQAAVRFVSYEPALAAVDFEPWLPHCEEDGHCSRCGCCWEDWKETMESHECPPGLSPRLDWLIFGGESGPGARPFDLDWARIAIEQCKAAGVPCFVKQLGARPFNWRFPNLPDLYVARLKDRKGGDMSEWPEDLRIREYPHAVRQI